MTGDLRPMRHDFLSPFRVSSLDPQIPSFARYAAGFGSAAFTLGFSQDNVSLFESMERVGSVDVERLKFYGPRMQEDAFWSTLEHFWAKIGWCKHGDMRMDEFDDSMG
ncbi:hypothetical protein DVH24_035976 [Malus domestica]|uniref:Uncharacterized protein n=1 Tax=Malus domestica TaxID=3750 RepID=A0A498JNI6_MALDO|nr:hypothetical protein DVH24_035976 [Malus domestica]